MASRANRRRRTLGASCETLEDRQLLAISHPAAEVRSLGLPGPAPQAPSLFIEPQAGRAPIIAAINSAHSRIRLGICNLSDPIIGDALAAAVARGVKVQVIVDRRDYESKAVERAEIASLIARNVSVHLSNGVFPQSFEKELVIDQRRVLIMTMCLTPATFFDTRDYGIVLSNPAIIREVTSVFDNDWTFSAPPGQPTQIYNPTPALRVPSLIWGPTTAIANLSQLIQSARRSIDVTTELLHDPYLEGQLVAARQRGVQVRMILPIDPIGGPPSAPQIKLLTSQGIGIRTTIGQSPPAGALPYMHAKTMVVDGRVAYLGSIDLDTTETSRDRELGIIFKQPRPVGQLRAQFQSDWNRATPPPVS